MGAWIALNLLKEFKNNLKAFIGIGSAPEFLDRLMWNKFSKKVKKIINKEKIYYLESKNGYTYPLTKHLFVDGKKNKVFNQKFNTKIPVTMFHGYNDEVVPIYFSKKILKIFLNSKKKLVIIKNGDHSLSKKNDLKKICKELNHIIFDLI